MYRKQIKNKGDNPEKDKDQKKEDIYKLSDSLFNATLHSGAFNCISELSSLLYKNGYIKDFLDKLFYNILYSYNISIGQLEGQIDINQIMESSYSKKGEYGILVWNILIYILKKFLFIY